MLVEPIVGFKTSTKVASLVQDKVSNVSSLVAVFGAVGFTGIAAIWRRSTIRGCGPGLKMFLFIYLFN